MTSFIFRRILTFIPTLIGISILVFFVIRQIPGDAITAKLGAEGSGSLTPEQEAQYRAYFGLDKPLTQQYLDWIGGVFHGDFGISEVRREPVLVAIFKTFPLTLELAILALFMALVIGIPIGVLSATRPGSAIDFVGRAVSLLALSLPNFWMGTLIILLLSSVFHVLPDQGLYIPFFEDPLRNLGQLLFPAFTLGFAFSGSLMRTTRAVMLETLNQDYIRTARSKGLRDRAVFIGHALRNGLLPIITLAGIEMGYLLGGTVLVEQVFALPGIGRLTYTAILQRDYALVQGAVLFIAFNFVLINLLVDFLYSLADPRIAHAGD
ncbi:MAG TPA: ABC transporter permease [Aggregatilineales bacterium]|nr:ABC transporter permease [Aggregatilineales bacterium]